MTASAHLREQLQFMISLLWQMVGVHGAVKCAAAAKALLREICTQEKHAFELWAKQALRRCPEWQARVFEDLGGQAGLKRWQARLRKSYDVVPEDDYAWLDMDPNNWPVPEETARGQKPVDKPRPKIRSAQFKTDRDGVFRWAKIKLGRSTRIGTSSNFRDRDGARYGFEMGPQYTHHFALKTARDMFSAPGLIELLPSDLIDDAEHEDVADPRIDLLKFWAGLQAVPRRCSDHLTDFTLKHQQARLGGLLVPP